MTRSVLTPAALAGIVAFASAGPALAQGQGYAGHGADSVPREKLVKYAPTALPADVTRRVQTMLDVRGAALGAVAPDGKRIYVTTGRFGKVIAVDTATEQVVGTIEVGTRPWGIGITPDGKTLYTDRKSVV